MGTNRGSISVMDRESGTRLKEIFFPCGTKRQVDIKHLAISNEDEVCVFWLSTVLYGLVIIYFLVQGTHVFSCTRGGWSHIMCVCSCMGM